MFNYEAKPDLKNAANFDTKEFTKIVNLASLKSVVDKLDIGELETAPTDLYC